jgi:hypothetical protein
MKLKTASLIAAIGCLALLIILTFLQLAYIDLDLRPYVFIAAFVIGFGSLINFFLILYKNQK